MAQKETSKDRLIHVRLSEATHKRMRIRVAELDTTIQQWVAALVEEELNKTERLRAEIDHE